jgi:hypothetical protein
MAAAIRTVGTSGIRAAAGLPASFDISQVLRNLGNLKTMARGASNNNPADALANALRQGTDLSDDAAKALGRTFADALPMDGGGAIRIVDEASNEVAFLARNFGEGKKGAIENVAATIGRQNLTKTVYIGNGMAAWRDGGRGAGDIVGGSASNSQAARNALRGVNQVDSSPEGIRKFTENLNVLVRGGGDVTEAQVAALLRSGTPPGRTWKGVAVAVVVGGIGVTYVILTAIEIAHWIKKKKYKGKIQKVGITGTFGDRADVAVDKKMDFPIYEQDVVKFKITGQELQMKEKAPCLEHRNGSFGDGQRTKEDERLMRVHTICEFSGDKKEVGCEDDDCVLGTMEFDPGSFAGVFYEAGGNLGKGLGGFAGGIGNIFGGFFKGLLGSGFMGMISSGLSVVLLVVFIIIPLIASSKR